MPVSPRRFSIDEYHRLLDGQVLRRGSRTELWDGVVVAQPSTSPRLAHAAARLEAGWRSALPEALVLLANTSLTLDRSELTPRLMVVRAEALAATVRHPREALVVVEAADEALEVVREEKLPLYARAGVPEVWLLNGPDVRVECFTRPDVQAGVYRATVVTDVSARAESVTVPGLEAKVAALLALPG